MTHHLPEPTELDADAAFERLLLRSASADSVTDTATREAWAKFARASAGVALVAAATPEPSALWRLARHSGLKWLLVGALGGGALTAAWLTRHGSGASGRIATAVTVAIPNAATASLGSAAAAPSASAQTELVTSPVQRGRPRPAKLSPSARAASTRAEGAPSDASALAAEVAALDAVQRAMAVQVFSRSVRLVDEYHRDFPNGQLAADAEAMAIEALAAQGEHAELERRGARFLARYTQDPHAARIAALLRR